jgi:hypothetical protein
MPGHGDRTRHKCQLPVEQCAGLPFLWNPERGELVAPWAKSRGHLPAFDQLRLDAVCAWLERLDGLPGLVWVWPDPNRAPTPVGQVGDGWLRHRMRDCAVYAV